MTATNYLERIIKVIKPYLADTSCQVYLFGSRATESAEAGSDFDNAIDAREDISRNLSLIREVLAQSIIPYKVDLVHLNTTSEAFRQQVDSEGILLWKN